MRARGAEHRQPRGAVEQVREAKALAFQLHGRAAVSARGTPAHFCAERPGHMRPAGAPRQRTNEVQAAPARARIQGQLRVQLKVSTWVPAQQAAQQVDRGRRRVRQRLSQRPRRRGREAQLPVVRQRGRAGPGGVVRAAQASDDATELVDVGLAREQRVQACARRAGRVRAGWAARARVHAAGLVDVDREREQWVQACRLAGRTG
jgi:hypothetical protein